MRTDESKFNNVFCQECGSTIQDVLEGHVNYTSGLAICNNCYDVLGEGDEDRLYYGDAEPQQ